MISELKNRMGLSLSAISFLSAALSSNIVFYNERTLDYMPGIIYGIVLVLCLYAFRRPVTQTWRLLIIGGSTALSYFTAFNTATYLFKGLKDIINEAFLIQLCFFVAGLIGSLIFVTAFQIVYRFLEINHYFGLIVIGGILGCVGFNITDSFSHGQDTTWFYLFTVWQTAMGFAIGHLLSYKDQTKRL